MKKEIGIYCFENETEKKVYIGQSSNLERRKYQHYHSRRDEFHLNLRENPDDFEYTVLQECLVKELNDLELMWINWYKNEGWTLYNKDIYKHYTNRGKPHSEEHRKKISESKKGKLPSEETRKKISESNKGKHRSEEYRKKMSESKKGHVPWNKGKTGIYSEQTKQKMSESNKGKVPWNKGKKIGHWRINQTTGKREWY